MIQNSKLYWSNSLKTSLIQNCDVYFLPEYLMIYELLGDGTVYCFMYSQEENVALYPFLLNPIDKSKYKLDREYFDIQGVYGYNGVVSNCYEKSFINNFYSEFNKYCQNNNIVAEFIRFSPLLNNHIFSKEHIDLHYDRDTVILDLTKDYQIIWEEEYTSKNRNMIRKSIKLGYSVQVYSEPSSKEIDRFIDSYYFTMNMAGADKYYYFNKNYFHNIFHYLKNNSCLINIFDNHGDLVGTAIFLYYGDYFHYHLSGRTEKADNSVNNFLLDNAVKYAKEKGFKLFYLGGGRSNKENDSLLKFKSNFSKSRFQFYIGKKIHNCEIYKAIINQWETDNIAKKDKYADILLRYRF